MLDWIFEGIITWISSIASSLMDAVSGLFLNALGADMTVMEEYFPFITVAYTVMQYMAWAILFLITVWQLFRTFGGPITEAEHPLHLIARSSIFALLIGYARPIFMVAVDIARAPYTALLDLSMTSEDFTFAGLEETLSNGLLTIASTVTVIAPILLLILLISIGWNYFKLLLETVERYIVVGVLCYTSPLAFAMGGSKETNQVFKSWCRMVGSQLLLLVMNVWFLRAFSSSVGQYIGNGGAVSTGHGSIFLWFFCALAFLKTAQRFDSYLASIGLNVAQTGSSMGMEMLMAARVLTGFAGSASSAGSVFRNTSAAGTATATGFAAGFANRFKPNSYVRDAVVEGGSRMGLGGSVGFVGRAFGGIAARNGATLTGDSISSVATRPDSVSGSIGGDIANRSLGNYMPQLGRHTLSNTQITGGHISTTATDAAGKTSNVELFNAAQFEAPTAPHSLVNAADGSSWYFIDDKKIIDPIVLADMKLAAETPTDVILFNIDSKSESTGKQNKDAIVNVFLKVFNQMQGFCGSIPHVADLERRLSEEGRNRNPFKGEFMIDGHTGFLFLDQYGMPKVAMHLENYLRNIQNKHEKETRTAFPRVTPHVLRHTFCTNAQKAGLDVKSLQYLMGHSHASVTLDVYTHTDYSSVLKAFDNIAVNL